MRQALLTAPRTLNWTELELPQPKAGEVLVRTRAALTCGTDLKTYRRGHPKIPFGPFGHEASGDIAALGSGVDRFNVGDPVMWVQTAPCGSCAPCRDGMENLCEHLTDEMALGAYASHVLLPAKIVARNLYAKPAALRYIEAAFLEPLACIVHGWSVLQRGGRASTRAGSLAIIGAGAIGLLHVLYAKHAGMSVTVIAHGEERASLARELGADRTLPSSAGQSGNFDAVIECAGTTSSWREAVELAAPCGRVLFFSGLPADTDVSLDAGRMHYQELTCCGSFHFTPDDVRTARDLLTEGALPVKRLISAVVPLDRLADVFERLEQRNGLKYALIPEPFEPQWV
ncbi:MAG: zinc-dependent alcohol dehydrogenase [Candidatus Eremiobacter antarcticus]|nr:alcohol dehydrogenase catalytic domain-containing protein [Candidatus Eremiobacteraeota bacterium]MBC5807517.1 alcohol dehydrogenase catalytic domain-containing protein [Candidatus Eremiobacteraeota bacterium]